MATKGKTVKTFTAKGDAESFARRQNTAIRRYKFKVEKRPKGYAVVKAPPYRIW